MTWKELIYEFDLPCFTEFHYCSAKDIEQIREFWKAARRTALNKLNEELNDSGKPEQLFNMDVSDEELYPYVSKEYQYRFFKWSRILDFNNGFIPKNLRIIKR